MINAEMTTFLGYFILLFFVAMYFFFNGGNRNQEDYFLGGRSMGPWVTAMSAQASDMSAWLLMGLPGSIMAFGFGQMWIGIGLALGTAANWMFCAKRLRKFSKAAGDAITLPQYLSNRFMTTSKTLQVICAIIFLMCFTVYVASAFVAGASVFTMIFPSVSAKTAMVLCIRKPDISFLLSAFPAYRRYNALSPWITSSPGTPPVPPGDSMHPGILYTDKNSVLWSPAGPHAVRQ